MTSFDKIMRQTRSATASKRSLGCRDTKCFLKQKRDVRRNLFAVKAPECVERSLTARDLES